MFWLIIHVAHSLWVALPLWGISGAAIFLLRHRLLADRFGRHGLILAAGGILLVLAVWIEYQTRRALRLRRLVGLAEVNAFSLCPPLVTLGIYARVCHPRYLGYLPGWMAVILFLGARGILGLAILHILLY